MKVIFLSFLILFGFVSCNWLGNAPSFGDDYITYQIKTGSHEVENNSNGLFTAGSMRFQAIFDSSCIYRTVIPENQNDINKLMGFSDCSTPHQTNSARFGWNWRDDALRIYAYIYVEGLRQEKELGTVQLGKASSFEIKTNANTYIFTFNGKETILPRYCSGGTGISYKLLPYFGGDETASHDMRIKIRDI